MPSKRQSDWTYLTYRVKFLVFQPISFVISVFSTELPVLLHIMRGYQCDKAMNKNDIISLHGAGLSNQIDCNNLVGQIGLHVILF